MSGWRAAAAGRCQCGKLRYLTRKAAKQDANRYRKQLGRMDTYRCGDFWHLGHLPGRVRRGEIARSELAAP